METDMEKATIIDINLELLAVSLGISVEKVTMIKVNSTMHIVTPMRYIGFILVNVKKSQKPTLPIFGDLTILFIKSCGLPTLVVTKTNIVAKINSVITTGTKTPRQ
jgi:hypothetical protein